MYLCTFNLAPSLKNLPQWGHRKVLDLLTVPEDVVFELFSSSLLLLYGVLFKSQIMSAAIIGSNSMLRSIAPNVLLSILGGFVIGMRGLELLELSSTFGLDELTSMNPFSSIIKSDTV